MQPFVITRRTDFKNVRLVDASNNFHDEVFIGTARDLAQNANLDLVCFEPPTQDGLALCKILDYGKWKYQDGKNKKKGQIHHKQSLKEMRFSPVISDHDVEHKLKQVAEFLAHGDEVLLVMRFKGIHRRNFNIGAERMNEIIEMSKSFGEEVTRKKADNQIVVRLKKRKDKKQMEVVV